MGAQISLELKHTAANKGGAPALAIADEVRRPKEIEPFWKLHSLAESASFERLKANHVKQLLQGSDKIRSSDIVFVPNSIAAHTSLFFVLLAAPPRLHATLSLFLFCHQIKVSEVELAKESVEQAAVIERD